MRFATIARLGLGLCAVALAVTACGSASGKHRSSGARVGVRERDFRILLRPARVPAGRVVITVDDVGPADHELILIRAPGGPLPLRHDGLTVDEGALEPVTIGALEPAAPGTVRRLDVTLRKGKYELFCNMAGHYLGGMHAFLVVT
ncbi:MAG: hypothetical protein ACJ75G_02665 [Gaiellaceae bacterium]